MATETPAAVLAAAAKIKPLRDKVCLWPVAYENPVLIVTGIKLDRGVVVAIGPGRPVKRLVRYRKGEGYITGDIYLPDGAQRVNADGSPMIRPMRVALGDVVEHSRHKHTLDFEIDGHQFVLIDENSVYGIDRSGSNSQAILSQRSAGWETGRGGAKDTFLAR